MAVKYQRIPMEIKEESSDIETLNEIRQRTKLGRTLFIVGVATLLFVFVMVVTLAAIGHIYQKYIENLMPCNSTNYDVCLTPGCIKAASDLLSNLDESVDPCEDFYRFACGGWMDSRLIPEERPTATVFTETRTGLHHQLKVLLEKEPNKLEPRFIKMAHEMYNLCMDIESIENLGAQLLKKDLDALGGWPVIEGNKWNASNFDWVQIILSLRKLGYNDGLLYETYVDLDSKNNTVHRIGLSEAELGIPDRSYFLNGLNDSITAAYFHLMVESAKLLGADETTAEKELLKVLQFETALANFTLSIEEQRKYAKEYHICTVGELKDIAPQIPWQQYFSGIVGEEISENETLIIYAPNFVNNTADLIAGTEKRVIANYLLWKVVYQSMPYLSREWKYMFHEYYSTFTGISKEAPRWEYCLSALIESLGKAVSSYYVRHYFTEESRETALKLFNYIHKEFLTTLDEIDWMDEETKTKARAKAKSLIYYIGYPEELLNNTVLLEFYENLTLPNKSYFDNMKIIHKWRVDSLFSELRKPNIRGEWKKFAKATDVNAFYRPQENGLAFLAGILQNKFFDKERPHYMNFGAIGFILGHEITHGYDDLGRQFNKDGNMMNWWDETTEKIFKAQIQCIIDQYSNYTAENGMKINGQGTQGENIADNGGVKLAYKAYLSWVKDNGKEQKLPGLKYNPTQMLLISTANTWCGKFRPEALKLRIIVGTHAPNRFRILGMMSNLEEFSKEFNCTSNSPMNKKNKCHIW